VTEAPNPDSAGLRASSTALLIDLPFLSDCPPLNLTGLYRFKLTLHDKLGKQRHAVRRYGIGLHGCDFLTRKLRLTGLAKRMALKKQSIDQRFIK